MKYKFSDIEEYFLKKLDSVKVILNSGKDFEGSLLALCYIDALGNLFIEGSSTVDKFLNLLFLYGTINNFRWDKVNIAELKKLETKYNLKSNICPFCYERIKQYIEQRFSQYDYSNSNDSMTKDRLLSEEINDIIAFGKDKTCECNIVSISLLKCLYNSTYGGTLYREYRCESVHKGKLPMLWSSLENHFDKEPCYVDVQDKLPDFSIPSIFIIKTLEQCLINLKKNDPPIWRNFA